jgi:hypothetical protein
VEITLATAAPMRVPATPNSEATTAEETAARAPAAIWTGLRMGLFSDGSALSARSSGEVFEAVMSSVGVDVREDGCTGPVGNGQDEAEADPGQRHRG